MRRATIVLIASLVAACSNGPAIPAYEWNLPPGFPVPRVPEDNPMSEAKVELGRYLFYDMRLSGNQTQACASCHRQELAFTDGAPQATGSTGEMTPRGAMSLTNIAYAARLTWMNDLVVHLEDQALLPMLGEMPVELGLSGRESELMQRLRDDAAYPQMFLDAFPGEPDPITLANVTKAIAAFERTLISGNSAFDRYTFQGDDAAMSASARAGLDLFNTERLDCYHCHGASLFTDTVDYEGLPEAQIGFENNALYNLDGRGSYPAPNRGLYEHTMRFADMGRFRAPTLRNIAITAPYMHDGTLATLDDVLDHYAAGGRTITDGPNAGDGSTSPLKSLFVHGFTLSAEERQSVMDLLNSLTDDQFLHDPRFASPF